jgi:hypothetical protein
MQDLAAAIGLVFAIEGLLLAAMPAIMRQSMLEAASRPDQWLRMVGLVAAGIGIVIVWLAREWL